MQQESAERIALGALAWLAGDEELIGVFLGSTGLSVEELRENAGDPQFLAGVLGFILMDDAWVIRCCDAQGIGYESIGRAVQVLPGGNPPDWT